jgi:hypothetical protein
MASSLGQCAEQHMALAYAVTIMHNALLFARKHRYTCLYLRGPSAPHGSMLNIITLTTRKACSQHALQQWHCKQLPQRALTQNTRHIYTGFSKQHTERSIKADSTMVPDVSCSKSSTSASSVEKCTSSSDASRTGYKPDMVHSCSSVCGVPLACTSTHYVTYF